MQGALRTSRQVCTFQLSCYFTRTSLRPWHATSETRLQTLFVYAHWTMMISYNLLTSKRVYGPQSKR
jgi:hypothetical protein